MLRAHVVALVVKRQLAQVHGAAISLALALREEPRAWAAAAATHTWTAGLAIGVLQGVQERELRGHGAGWGGVGFHTPARALPEPHANTSARDMMDQRSPPDWKDGLRRS